MALRTDSQAAIILAAASRHVARAVRRGQDEWLVGYSLRDHDVRCLAADPLNPSVIYAGTQGKGVLRSEDYGATWKPAGLDGRIIKSLAISRVEQDTIYAGTKPAWLFVSRDGSSFRSTWDRCMI